jgi:TATA-binding protein-associated factor Taf7
MGVIQTSPLARRAEFCSARNSKRKNDPCRPRAAAAAKNKASSFWKQYHCQDLEDTFVVRALFPVRTLSSRRQSENSKSKNCKKMTDAHDPSKDAEVVDNEEDHGDDDDNEEDEENDGVNKDGTAAGQDVLDEHELGGNLHLKKKRLCRMIGCTRVIKSQGCCQRHGAKARRCKVDGCDKQGTISA